MASGQQKAAENLSTFHAWVAGKSDDDFREYVFRDVLNRTEIAKECGFAKSALRQNPAIKDALERLENDLRARNVLPTNAGAAKPKKPPQRDSEAPQRRRDAQRLARLEQENAALRSHLAAAEAKFKQYALLEEFLRETGRAVR